jgi:hypothetical protein
LWLALSTETTVAALFCSIMLALLPAVLIPGLRVHIRPHGADISMSCFRGDAPGRAVSAGAPGVLPVDIVGGTHHASRLPRHQVAGHDRED